MNDTTQAVTVKILDKEYRVACPKGEHEALISSAREVDSRMRDIRRNGKVINADRIAVLVALNLAHELMKAQTQVNNIDGDIFDRLDQLQTNIKQTLNSCAQHEGSH